MRHAVVLATGICMALVAGPLLAARATVLRNATLIDGTGTADLVVLDSNPLDDIRNTRKIGAIYHHGRAVANPAPKD